ncbi:hypothetical protein BDY19DRAFT_996267 [Irpex rosettiformis]|uniref:Uncharacterized protein n=1 Tax=Irpex rosettiformis TaxID=378272 RepID=A0ACB8TW53_9APHY|nr:hypothetical protein BDY19DRAFT_996267 [Irpex rosettiformis]
MTGDGVKKASASSRANIGISVEDASNAAHGAAIILLTKPGLSIIVHAIHDSRAIFQKCLNLTLSTIALVAASIKTNSSTMPLVFTAPTVPPPATTTIASFTPLSTCKSPSSRRPSSSLLVLTASSWSVRRLRCSALCRANLVFSIIAAYGSWGSTGIKVTGLDIVWFLPMDLIKFAMKATVIKYTFMSVARPPSAQTICSPCDILAHRTQSRAASIHKLLYSDCSCVVLPAGLASGGRGALSFLEYPSYTDGLCAHSPSFSTGRVDVSPLYRLDLKHTRTNASV